MMRCLTSITAAGACLLMGLRPAAGTAADLDALRGVIDELPYPGLNFDLGVAMGEREVALMHVGEPNALLRRAEARLAEVPDDPRAHLDRAMAWEALGTGGFIEEYQRAAELWKPIVEADPADAEARLGLAQALWEGGDVEAALPVVEELAAEHSELWWPHCALARHASTALWDLVGVFNMPQAAGAETDEAFGQWFDGVKTPALEGLTDAVVEMRDDPEALGDLLQQLADNALAHVATAQEAAPGEPSIRLLGVLIRMQALIARSTITRKGSALSAFGSVADEVRGVASDFPDRPRVQLFARWATVSRAMANADGGDFMALWQQIGPEDRSLIAWDELATNQLAKSPEGQTSDTYELLAVYALLHGNLGEALARLEESTRVDPTSGERWEAYVGTMTRTGDFDRIRAAIEEGLKHLDNGTLRAALAKTHQRQGNPEQAEEHLLAAIEHDDARAPFARLMLGIIWLKRGDSQGAVEPLRAASEAWRDDGLAELALGVALGMLGEDDEARAHLSKARDLAPDDELVGKAAEAVG